MTKDVDEELRRGVSAHRAGDLDAAAAAYGAILAALPGHADALHLMGLVRAQQGASEEAVTLIRDAIAGNGTVALYHGNLGRALKAMGDDAGAVLALRDAVRLAPEEASFHADLAAALFGIGDAAGARSRALMALNMVPDMAEAHLTLGLALQRIYGPSHVDALRELEKAIHFNPSLGGAYLGIGIARHESGDREGAWVAYERALAVQPNLVEAHTNLGNLARDAGDFEDAISHYRAALDIKAGVAEIWGNLGVALQEAGRLEEAISTYEHALSIAPEDADIRRNRAHALLASERFEEGWHELEWRWRTTHMAPYRKRWRVPEWRGGDPRGKHLLVHAEQGLGDALQFCRYIPLLAGMGARITVECADALAPLFVTLPGVVRMIRPGTSIPPVDAHVSMMSLPFCFGTAADSIPADVPYIGVPQKSARKWAPRAAAWPEGMRIGIAWRGSPNHVRDAVRSPGLAPFLALAEVPGAVLVSLQKDGGTEDIAATPGAAGIVDPTPEIEDFADTAAIVSHLDAIVSCDSAPLHLAGAMGARAVAMLPHVAEWRWGRADVTPWYPTMTLVRQPAFGDWTGAFESVCRLLSGK